MAKCKVRRLFEGAALWLGESNCFYQILERSEHVRTNRHRHKSLVKISLSELNKLHACPVRCTKSLVLETTFLIDLLVVWQEGDVGEGRQMGPAFLLVFYTPLFTTDFLINMNAL